MPLCPKHGFLYGEGCTCEKCDAEKKRKPIAAKPGTKSTIRSTKPIR